MIIYSKKVGFHEWRRAHKRARLNNRMDNYKKQILLMSSVDSLMRIPRLYRNSNCRNNDLSTYFLHR